MSDFNGLGEPLHDSPDAKADIVFVHGLNGDRVKTWTSEPSKRSQDPVYWPEKLLPARCPNARILSFGYNASILEFYPWYGPKAVVNTTVNNHSAALLDSLVGLRNRTNTSGRPVIFVAHSMGGLVCANAVSRNYGSDKSKENLVNMVRGMIFMGTPFAGSKYAKWGEIGLSLVSSFATTNTENMKDLQERSKLLVEINHNFAQFIKSRDRAPPYVEIACYFEELPTRLKGKSIGFIVDKDSATLIGIEPLSIEEDHADMSKFEDPYRRGFISIADKLEMWIKSFDDEKIDEESDNLSQGGMSMGAIHYHAPISSNTGVITGHINTTAKNGTRIIGTKTTNNW